MTRDEERALTGLTSSAILTKLARRPAAGGGCTEGANTAPAGAIRDPRSGAAWFKESSAGGAGPLLNAAAELLPAVSPPLLSRRYQ